jgi:hypothetical protein
MEAESFNAATVAAHGLIGFIEMQRANLTAEEIEKLESAFNIVEAKRNEILLTVVKNYTQPSLN